MFRLLLFMLFAGITTLGATSTTDFVPLSSKDGKLNRPILFVHGFNTDARSWGVDYAYSRCLLPEFTLADAKIIESEAISQKLLLNLNNKQSDGKKAIPYRYVLKTHGLKIQIEGKLKCSDGRSFNMKDTIQYIVQDADIFDKVIFTSNLAALNTIIYHSSNSGYYGYTKNNNTLEIEVLDIEKTRKIEVDSKVPSQIVEPKFKKVKLDFQKILSDKYSVNTGFLTRSIKADYISKDYQSGSDDKIMAYRKESVPYALATMFNLNTDFVIDSVDHGINNNGLYFYNSKHYVDRMIEGKSGCENYNLKMNLGVLDSIRNKSPNDSRKTLYYWTQHITFTYDQKCYDENGTLLYSNIARREKIMLDYGAGHFKETYYTAHELNCNTDIGCAFKEKIKPEEFIFRNDSLIVEKKHWYFELNDAPDDERFSDKFVYALNEALPIKTSLLALSPRAHPVNGTEKDPAQVDQLKEKIKTTLSEHYGADWVNDPNAKIDLVGHSQGGLIIKQMYAKHTDAALKNPLNHVNKIITLNSPFNGSALATPNAKIEEGHYIYGNNVGPKITNKQSGPLLARTYEKFPELAKTKDLINGNQPIKINGSLEYSEFLNIFSRSLVQGADLFLLGIFNGVDDKLDFTISAPSIYGPYALSLNGKLLDFEVFEKYDFNDAKKGIEDLEKVASHLAWSENSGFMNENYNVNDARNEYTRKSIPFTTFRTEGVGSILTNEGLAQLEMALSKKLCKVISDKIWDWAETGSLINMCNGRIAKVAGKLDIADYVLDLVSDVIKLDEEWSENSDLVVEASSQTGINKNTMLSGDKNAFFKTNVHRVNKGHVPHVSGLEDMLNGTGGAAWQQHSVICELVSAQNSELCAGGEVLDFEQDLEIAKLLNSSIERYGIESIELNGVGELSIDLNNFLDRELKSSQIQILSEIGTMTNIIKIFVDSLSSELILINENDTIKLVTDDVVNLKWADGKFILSVQDFNKLKPNKTILTMALGDLTTLNLLIPKENESSQNKSFPVLFKGKTQNYQTDLFVEIPLRSIELSTQNNISKLMFALPEDYSVNEVGAFKISYAMQSNSVEQPIVKLNSTAAYEYYVERINDQNSMLIVEVDSVQKLLDHPINLEFRWKDWRLYNKANDFSNPINEKKGSRIQISSRSARVPKSFVDQIKNESNLKQTQIDLKISKMTLEKNNLKWKIELKNNSFKESDSLQFDFLILHNKKIVLDSYYGNKCKIEINEFNDLISIASVACEKLFEGENAEIQFGIHNQDWSDLDSGSVKLETYSGGFENAELLLKNNYELGKSIIGLDKNDLYKTYYESEIAKIDSTLSTNSLANKIEVYNESPDEENHLKLRIRAQVENKKANKVEFDLKFEKRLDKALILEKYYVEGCEVKGYESAIDYRLNFNCSNKNTNYFWPNEQGWVIGLHYQDWSKLNLEYPKNTEWKKYVQ